MQRCPHAVENIKQHLRKFSSLSGFGQRRRDYSRPYGYERQYPTIRYGPFTELHGEFLLEFYPVALCAAAALPIILWDMLKLTHRIAGPMVRFRNVLRQLARGERVEQVTLRRGDLLVELRDAFNEFLDVLNLMSLSSPMNRPH